MGTSKGIPQFVAKIERAEQQLRKAQREVLEDAAFATKQIVEASVRRVVPDLRLSGRNNARVGVRYDVKGRQNPTAMVRATGPMQLVEHDVGQHVILASGLGTRATGRRVATSRAAFGGSVRGMFRTSQRATLGGRPAATRRATKRALTVPAGLRAYAFHPGTKGQEPFARGQREAIPVATKIVAAKTIGVLRGVFH